MAALLQTKPNGLVTSSDPEDERRIKFAGFTESTDEALDRIEAQAKALGKDGKPIALAVAPMRAGLKGIRAADRQRSAVLIRASPFIRQLLQEADQHARANGQDAQAARDRVWRAAEENGMRETLDAVQGRLNEIAIEATRTMAAIGPYLARRAAEVLRRPSLKAETPDRFFLQVGSARIEFASYGLECVTHIEAQYMSALDEGDLKRAVLIEEAATVVLQDLLRDAAPFVSRILPPRAGETIKAQMKAGSLLQMFEQQRMGRIPDSLRAASDLYTDLQSVWRVVFGVMPLLQSDAEINAQWIHNPNWTREIIEQVSTRPRVASDWIFRWSNMSAVQAAQRTAQQMKSILPAGLPGKNSQTGRRP
jgi:hypothetical protein